MKSGHWTDCKQNVQARWLRRSAGLRRLFSVAVLPLALAVLLPGAVASAAPRIVSPAGPDGTCGFCVLAPSGTSLTDTGNGAAVVDGGNIVVDSAGTPAVKVTGDGKISAPSVGVVGSASTTGHGVITNLTTGIQPIPDP